MIRSLPASSLPASNVGATRNPKDLVKVARKGFKHAHQLSGGEVCEKLGVDPRFGLSTMQVTTRLEKYGYNVIPGCKDATGLTKWIATNNTQTYSVYRNETQVQVASKSLVAGDIITLEAGQNIPADIRILRCDISVEKRPVYVPGTGFRYAEVEVATTLDTADIGKPSPSPASSGMSSEKVQHLAENMAIRGCTVLSGKLVGVVVAIGGACRSTVSKPAVKFSNPFKLSKNVDRKKLFRLCDQLESLGLAVQSTDAVPVFCNLKSLFVVLAVSAKHLPHLNALLPQLVGQGHRVVVHVGHDVNPRKDISQITSLSIGRPMDLENIHQLCSTQHALEVVARLKLENVVVTMGPEEGAEALISTIKELLQQPVVFFGESIDYVPSLSAADMSICGFECSASIRTAAKCVLGPRGLKLLALHLKLMTEANDINTL